MKKLLLCISLVLLFNFTGCSENTGEIVKINKISYEKNDVNVVEAVKTDIVPTTTITLKQDGRRYIDYNLPDANMEFEKLHVHIGDKVSAGDILVSFKNEAIEQKISEYKNRIEENRLLIAHYEKLNKIENSKTHDRDITLLKRDINVSELYLEEYEASYEKCIIRASEDGKITSILPELELGYCTHMNNIITEMCGSGTYISYVYDDYNYKAGEKYKASLSGIEFEFTLTKIEEDGSKQILYFEPESDISSLSAFDTLTMVIEKDVIKDAVAVPAKAVYTEGNNSCVLVQKENGYFERVSVEKGELINGMIIITSGLNGGEKVKI